MRGGGGGGGGLLFSPRKTTCELLVASLGV